MNFWVSVIFIAIWACKEITCYFFGVKKAASWSILSLLNNWNDCGDINLKVLKISRNTRFLRQEIVMIRRSKFSDLINTIRHNFFEIFFSLLLFVCLSKYNSQFFIQKNHKNILPDTKIFRLKIFINFILIRILFFSFRHIIYFTSYSLHYILFII